MTFADLFAGIGGFRLGLERAGMTCAWSCEIEKSCRRMYAQNFGKEPEYGDIRTVNNPPRVDLIAGGFPCQDVSIAGKRAGLAGSRSGLFFELMRVVEQTRPGWIFLENVPGLLFSCEGADFGFVLAAMGQLGYGVAWRILNAQHFGLAQRRRRVWIVGHLGGPCPPEILFEPKGGGRDSTAIKEAGTDITPCLRDRANCSHRADAEPFVVRQAMSAKWSKGSSGPAGDEHHNLVVTAPLRHNEQSQTADANGVRETTGVPGRLDPPDGPRYRALGNAVPVPVVEWIGRRISAANRKGKENDTVL